MPKYKYKCDYCSEEWETWMGFGDPDPETCPKCELGFPFKIPSKFNKAEKHTTSKSVGSVVENSIVEIKEELKKEKQLIRNKKYDDF
jgi:putative FmdB family regulatory protein